MRIRYFTLMFSMLALLPPSAQAREAFEGVWARTDKECRDEDGPNSRVVIDLDSKGGPLADRYEWHCKILKRAPVEQATRVHLRCHEFWEEYTKNQNGELRSETWSVRSPTRMLIDGKPFVRCIR